MFKVILSSLVMILIVQGCRMGGTTSPKVNSETMVKEGYYKDLLYFRTRRSGSSCVNSWNHSDIVTYNLSNGNFVYVESAMCGCFMHWEIDRKTKKVLAYTTEGKTCYKLDLVQNPDWYRGTKGVGVSRHVKNPQQ